MMSLQLWSRFLPLWLWSQEKCNPIHTEDLKQVLGFLDHKAYIWFLSLSRSAPHGAWFLSMLSRIGHFCGYHKGSTKLITLPAQLFNLACPKQTSWLSLPMGSSSNLLYPHSSDGSSSTLKVIPDLDFALFLSSTSSPSANPAGCTSNTDPKSYHFSSQHHPLSNRPWQQSLTVVLAA